MSVRSQIVSQFESVSIEQKQDLAPLSNLMLMDSALDSVCSAVTLARLGDELGFDPLR